MAKLALVYGLRLVPAEDLEAVGRAEIQLSGGRTASLSLHLIEGENEEQVREQLLRSIDAFFEFYPEI